MKNHSYSTRSREQLDTCRDELQAIFKKVLNVFDHTILEGHRGEEKQNDLFDLRRSKVKYPDGKHNSEPSKAVDATPYPVKWPSLSENPTKKEALEYSKEVGRFYYFAGHVKMCAEMMGTPVRFGGDWDGDNDLSDQHFDDLVHFEL